MAAALVGVGSSGQDPSLASQDFFEQYVRPVLVENCLECHGPNESAGGLRVDSREQLIQGGHTSAALVPGDATNSLIMRALQRRGDLAMPPDEPLADKDIQAIAKWIEAGAAWPRSEPISSQEPATPHWAFQNVQPSTPPRLNTASPLQNPIDSFVAARLLDAGLSLSPPADRRTLIRRLYYSVTGLPPDPQTAAAFLEDDSADAYERCVERLLASPTMGEQWARHWLDVARYSDTKGYVYAREERRWVHAWAYRDWVIRAFNQDMPYDQFLLLQLAADQVEQRRVDDLAAMGFLTIGRRFLGVRRDIIDDQIDVVSRGMLGLTVNCARCHDHKYDPIPTADYYSLYGVFDSSFEQQVRLSPKTQDQTLESDIAKLEDELQREMQKARAISSQRVRSRIADYLYAQSELHKYPPSGFDQIFQSEDLLPAFVHRWKRYLAQASNADASIFSLFQSYLKLPREGFANSAAQTHARLVESAYSNTHPLLIEKFTAPPTSFREVCDRYGEIFAKIIADSGASADDEPSHAQITDMKQRLPTAHAFIDALYGSESPCSVPPGPISHTESYFDTDTCTALWKLQGNIDRRLLDAKEEITVALAVADKPQAVEPRIFRRGDPTKPGRRVPRQFLEVIADNISQQERQPFQHGSGRLELAEAITSDRNPLTARVIVNRLWAHYFGHGLVRTPSDFGTRADPPSHPELLDWLAAELIRRNWSLKEIHRLILLSSTFRQTSAEPANAGQLALALGKDPDNRLLWRMNARRLTFEELRDSLAAVSEQLNRRVGGKPNALFPETPPMRRSIYGQIDRQYLPSVLRTFDFASPDLHVPQRNETTVPQQALFFLNHPAVHDATRQLVASLPESEQGARVQELFARVLQRQPTAHEVTESLELLAAAAARDTTSKLPPTAVDWSYGFGKVDEDAQATKDFRLLPYFNGTAWQGGPSWPDDKLGWVQLSSAGGHPGNDLAHAAIRRWTAPRTMRVRIQSQLVHEPQEGDGIRMFILSSRVGLLHEAKLHHSQDAWSSNPMQVDAGDTLDFVVDIGQGLNNDQFLWTIELAEEERPDAPRWNSANDFRSEHVSPLDPWEQLAQVLLCTNEFLFVD